VLREIADLAGSAGGKFRTQFGGMYRIVVAERI
jgi:hypothetical protein